MTLQIVFLYRNGKFHFGVAERGDGSQPYTLLDLANSIPTQVEDGEHSNRITIAGATGVASWKLPQVKGDHLVADDQQAFWLELYTALTAEFPSLATSNVTYTRWYWTPDNVLANLPAPDPE